MAWTKTKAKVLKRGNAVVGANVVLADGNGAVTFDYVRPANQSLTAFKKMVNAEITAWLGHYNTSGVLEDTDL